MGSLDTYRELVRRAALRRDGKPIYNASDEHASIVVEEIFRNANRQVSILTGHLAPRIYARARPLQWAKIFLSDPDHKLRLLVKEGDLSKLAVNSGYEELQDFANLQVKALPDEIEEQVLFRFVVADSDLYRFEPDKTRCDAVAGFGSDEVATHLQSIYDELWEHSNSVDRKTLKVVRTLDYDEAPHAEVG